ncbi:hypothetical protein ACH5RR_029616 [Cinchona calisaya]|uniref:Uncharacterized protein n=1 Tax=Cinchona calisaya TaxID=153742 RepID=A0ABD2YS58_9GENT
MINTTVMEETTAISNSNASIASSHSDSNKVEVFSHAHFALKLVHIHDDHHSKLRRCKVFQIDEDDILDSLSDSSRVNHMPQTRDYLSSMYRDFLRLWAIGSDFDVIESVSEYLGRAIPNNWAMEECPEINF